MPGQMRMTGPCLWKLPSHNKLDLTNLVDQWYHFPAVIGWEHSEI